MQHRLLPNRLLAATTTFSPHPIPHHQRISFHTTPHHREENHYTALESPPTSTPAHLKKQFYALSKRHHPDLHPNDASASQRFVRISTAWSILGNESKRAQYDRDLFRQNPELFGFASSAEAHDAAARGGPTRGGPMPSGSHSSAQAAAWGARPASGLSRRRGAFRGPPPSFYRSGGWGVHGEKRKAAAEGAEDAARRSTDAGAGNGGGFAPGQGGEHADFEVPHFDRQGHFKRQESVEEALRKRRTILAEREAMEREDDGSGAWARFGIVSGALVMTGLLATVWEWGSEKKRKK